MSTAQNKRLNTLDVTIRTLQKRELDTADHIFRLAFGTFLALPNPEMFAGDSDILRTRWKADPTRVFAAEVAGGLVGTNVASNWGSVGFFGPLTIRPDLWDHGIAQRLMEAVMEQFSAWETKHTGLFTFSHSPKHLALYQKFGFYPRFLTALLSKPVAASASGVTWTTLSSLPKSEQRSLLQACRDVTEANYEGLDVRGEIHAVEERQLGETILLWNRSRLAGFACCHCGAGTEAETGTCYIKFGTVLPGANAQCTLSSSCRHAKPRLRLKAYPAWWQESIWGEKKPISSFLPPASVLISLGSSWSDPMKLATITAGSTLLMIGANALRQHALISNKSIASQAATERRISSIMELPPPDSSKIVSCESFGIVVP